MKDEKLIKALCVLCGENLSTTDDHVPPKGIFTRPLPSDLVTVPACQQCNGKYSKTDEEFRNFLSLAVGTGTENTFKLWSDKTIRGIRRNKRVHRELLQSMRDEFIKTQHGLIIGKGTFIVCEVASVRSGMEHITRGLYFHHFKNILDPTARIEVFRPMSNLDEELFKLVEGLASNAIGETQFVYKYGRFEPEKSISLWLFQFYERLWFLVRTSPSRITWEEIVQNQGQK